MARKASSPLRAGTRTRLVCRARLGHGRKGLWTGTDLGLAELSQFVGGGLGSRDRAEGDRREARPIHRSSHDGGAQRAEFVLGGLVRASVLAVPDRRGWSGAFGLGLVRPALRMRGVPFSGR